MYASQETRAIADAAHELEMYVHVDGARLANAAASLEVPAPRPDHRLWRRRRLVWRDQERAPARRRVSCSCARSSRRTRYTRKQLGQLASKMRFLAVQFDALLEGDLWRANASHANAMARRLVGGIAEPRGLTSPTPSRPTASS